jgi:hypothetical protein
VEQKLQLAEEANIGACCTGPMPIPDLSTNADNQGSIFIGSNPVQERHTKHIDICYHYVHECIENEDVSVVFIEGKDNPADMFTKNLGVTLFLKF